MAERVLQFPLRTRIDNRPLCVGLSGPPGGGKTASALRLAQGIQEVRGGSIRVLDTEGGRSAKYQGERIAGGAPFEFEFALMDPPFRADRYMQALTELSADNPACIIIDSISDEHEGEGGRLDWHREQTKLLLERANREPGYDWETDWQGQQRVSMSAWQPSSAARNALAAKILRHPIPLILTFRAREKTRPVAKEKGEGRNKRTVQEPTSLGFQPIAAPEIVHTCDLFALLPARADGKVTWETGNAYSDFTLKLPEYFRGLFAEGQAISPEQGKQLAYWVKNNRLNGDNATQPDMERLWQQACKIAREQGMVALGERLQDLKPEKVAYLKSRWSELEDIAAQQSAA